MAVEFDVLGDIEVRIDGTAVDIGPARRRCVLAALLAELNTAVSLDQLADRVWGGRLPHRARNTLYGYLSRLRQVLEPAPEVSIIRTQAGYVLTADPRTVDLYRFRDLVARARSADDDRALELYDEALRLWRGDAFAHLDTPWLNQVRDLLAKERLAAELDRGDVQLRSGRHARLLEGLSAHAAAHPLDERLAGQFMLALYRGGRQAEALEYYQRTRQRLAEELGADPSPPLRRLHQQILTGAADLDAPRPAAAPGPHSLPRDVDDFTGRDTELEHLLEPSTVDDQAVAVHAIDGMAGVGKTALALRTAHRLRDEYPDAQLFLDLHAHTAGHEPTDPAAALDTLLRMLHVPADRIPSGLQERAGLWRAELANRRTLVILDNAATAAQVRPLLPGNPGCLVLITSRHRLSDLESVRTVSLGLLPEAEAIALFARAAGDDRAAAEPAATAEVARLCGRLPLALRIAAARLRARPAWTVAHLADRLRQAQRRLREFAVGDRSVAAAFDLSYRHLDPARQRLFRLLGLYPGTDFDAYLAAAATGLPLAEAERALEDLVDVHLLEQPGVGRYQPHDLLRAYATELAESTDTAEDRHAALTRVFDHYRYTASAAMDVIAPYERDRRPRIPAPDTPVPAFTGYDQALAWLETERANLLAAAHAARRDWPVHTGHLSTTLWRYLDLRGHYDDALTLHTYALNAARDAGDRTLEGHALHNLGIVYRQLDRYREALPHVEGAQAVAAETGDHALEGYALINLAIVCRQLGRHQDALRHGEKALAVAREIGNRAVAGYALNNLGLGWQHVGEYDKACAHYQEASALARDTGDRTLEGFTLNNLANICIRQDRHTDARTHLERTLGIAREIRNRTLEGYVLDSLGIVHCQIGRYDEALAHLETAAAIARDTGDRTLECYAITNLANTYVRLDRPGDAQPRLRQALDIARDTGDRLLESEVLNSLGEAAAQDPREAIAWHDQARSLAQDTRNRSEQARALDGLGRARQALGQPEQARDHWRHALALYTELGVPRVEEIRRRLEALPAS
ncbi:AfsR/SARP family transcriptional regulator [Amycolatopsis anabasis]|uniref:AfsR/SARP family transcriptional regulator n=1 Tax=Amycolatopsis anabasis TaxID=1840409 RepID=UPI00131DFF81|nr:tetratricopeptide repeat protein [Amycolatopsis anabasis]